MSSELTIQTGVTLKIDSATEEALRNLLLTSQQETPILALMKKGSGVGDEPVNTSWTVMTHDRQILTLIPYLAFRVNDLPIFATHYDLEGLRTRLCAFKLHFADGRLLVELAGDEPEVW